MEVLLLEQKHLIGLRTHRLFLHNTAESLHTDLGVKALTLILEWTCGLHNDLKANKTNMEVESNHFYPPIHPLFSPICARKQTKTKMSFKNTLILD